MSNSVLIAVDDSEFSRAAVSTVIEHLRPETNAIHVLHVLELDRVLPPAFDFARGADYGPEVTALLKAGRDAADLLVSQIAQRFREAGFWAETAVREGDPRHTILDYAAEIGCSCIVMGSHGRRGVERFFMGSVSEAVVRHARCSVLVVRPSTRSSPPVEFSTASSNTAR